MLSSGPVMSGTTKVAVKTALKHGPPLNHHLYTVTTLRPHFGDSRGHRMCLSSGTTLPVIAGLLMLRSPVIIVRRGQSQRRSPIQLAFKPLTLLRHKQLTASLL